MNYKMIRFVISWVLKVEGMLMLFRLHPSHPTAESHPLLLVLRDDTDN